MGIIVSFLAWSWETIFSTVFRNSPNDRGFLLLPLCPIYGVSLVLIYLLIRTPRTMSVLGKEIFPKNALLRYVSYFVLSALIATAVEFFVGLFFVKVFGIYLWYYADGIGNVMGLISLIPSLNWGIAITAFMRIVFDPILVWLGKRSERFLNISFWILLTLFTADCIFNFSYAVIHGTRFILPFYR